MSTGEVLDMGLTEVLTVMTQAINTKIVALAADKQWDTMDSAAQKCATDNAIEELKHELG